MVDISSSTISQQLSGKEVAALKIAPETPRLATVMLIRVINGYDASNVVNIQSRLYKAFAGTAVVGAAYNRAAVIIERIIMGTVGLVIGGLIRSALASNGDTTWRWAFYMNLLWAGLVLIMAFIYISSKYLRVDIPFSGSVWDWGSGASIAVWVVFECAIPVYLFRRLNLVPLWVVSGCARVLDTGTFYYTPLFFTFTRGHSPLQQTICLLPFVIVFIAAIVLTSGPLPLFSGYNIIYIISLGSVGSVIMFNLAQIDSITYYLLKDTIGGVSSVIWESEDPDILTRGVEAVTNIFAKK
ncbi:hypothetical protein BDV26DRAFT_276984 [Aspergillus bertholletiae]|uniref:Uncharacterized protein n=1 Tax=Aspergillus bertholletiae TaxID=1226010 RepID=A0A5N7BPF3_9EURO|nr:hypothetical protein BDV26DRAFT_276984 [Aspergillus bertholletiae]